MSTPIHVSVAWPYANGDLHVGHLAGALLPADIFARYHRLKGNRVLMVSGTDAHGTPITVEADKRGIAPRHLFEHYHHRFLEIQKLLGIATICLPTPIRKIIIVSLSRFSCVSTVRAISIRRSRCSSTLKAPDTSCPTAM